MHESTQHESFCLLFRGRGGSGDKAVIGDRMIRIVVSQMPHKLTFDGMARVEQEVGISRPIGHPLMDLAQRKIVIG
jgi:hypothetical protein